MIQKILKGLGISLMVLLMMAGCSTSREESASQDSAVEEQDSASPAVLREELEEEPAPAARQRSNDFLDSIGSPEKKSKEQRKVDTGDDDMERLD